LNRSFQIKYNQNNLLFNIYLARDPRFEIDLDPDF